MLRHSPRASSCYAFACLSSEGHDESFSRTVAQIFDLLDLRRNMVSRWFPDGHPSYSLYERKTNGKTFSFHRTFIFLDCRAFRGYKTPRNRLLGPYFLSHLTVLLAHTCALLLLKKPCCWSSSTNRCAGAHVTSSRACMQSFEKTKSTLRLRLTNSEALQVPIGNKVGLAEKYHARIKRALEILERSFRQKQHAWAGHQGVSNIRTKTEWHSIRSPKQGA